MRSYNSWGARLCAVALGLTLLPNPAAAQFLTTDVPHIGVQLAEFAKKAMNWVDQLKNFEVVRDAYAAAETANDISTGISQVTNQVRDLTNQGLALQQSIQANLKKVASIKDLKVSNMTDLKNLALNLSNLSLTRALPALGQTVRFTQALDRAQDADAAIVADALNVSSTQTGVSRTAQGTREQRSTAAMSMLALENKTQHDRIEQAFQFNKMADELVTSATELQATTNTENALTMTDGERIEAQSKASDMFLKAQELRNKASELLALANQRGPAQLAADQALADLHNVAGFNAMHHQYHPDEDIDF